MKLLLIQSSGCLIWGVKIYSYSLFIIGLSQPSDKNLSPAVRLIFHHVIISG